MPDSRSRAAFQGRKPYQVQFEKKVVQRQTGRGPEGGGGAGTCAKMDEKCSLPLEHVTRPRAMGGGRVARQRRWSARRSRGVFRGFQTP